MTKLNRVLYGFLMLFAAAGLFVSIGLHLLAAARLQGLTRPMELFIFWGGPTFSAWTATALAVRLRLRHRAPVPFEKAWAQSPGWPGWLTVILLLYALVTSLAEPLRGWSVRVPDAYSALRVWSAVGMAFYAAGLAGLFGLRKAEEFCNAAAGRDATPRQ